MSAADLHRCVVVRAVERVRNVVVITSVNFASVFVSVSYLPLLTSESLLFLRNINQYPLRCVMMTGMCSEHE